MGFLDFPILCFETSFAIAWEDELINNNQSPACSHCSLRFGYDFNGNASDELKQMVNAAMPFFAPPTVALPQQSIYLWQSWLPPYQMLLQPFHYTGGQIIPAAAPDMRQCQWPWWSQPSQRILKQMNATARFLCR